MLFLLMIVSTAFAQNLEKYQWKNRIILLKENNLDSDWLKGQLKRLQSDSKELEKRDVIIFVIAGGTVYDGKMIKTELNIGSIIETYGLTNFQGLALIGKDGGIKLKEAFIVNSKTIFEFIDSMPMRKEESNNN